MIVWSGKGIVALLPFPVLVGIYLLFRNGLSLAEPTSVGLGLGLGGPIGAAFLWWLDRWLEQRNPPRTLVDPRTGQQYVHKRRDTFFWIPLRVLWIPYVAVALAGLVLLVLG